MYSGWLEFFRTRLGRKREFVSLDAHRSSPEVRTFELLRVATPTGDELNNTVTSPGETHVSPAERKSPDYFSSQGMQRTYKTPPLSYSSPTPPDVRSTLEIFDPKTSYGRGGLGLHSIEEGRSDKI